MDYTRPSRDVVLLRRCEKKLARARQARDQARAEAAMLKDLHKKSVKEAWLYCADLAHDRLQEIRCLREQLDAARVAGEKGTT